jgi:hypothetical protein
MPKLLVFLGALAATAVTVLLVALADVPMRDVLTLMLGALCLLWLLVLLTVPWNLYFQARALIHEIRVSRERGIAVSAEKEPEARRIARLMCWFAVGAHLVSASLAVLVTYLAGGSAGYWLAGLFLLSTAFRPAHAYFGYLRSRMRVLLKEVRYPRDDVSDVLEKLAALTSQVDALAASSQTQGKQLGALHARVETVDLDARDRDDDLHRTVDAHGRQFEHALSRLTDNQEVIAGLKAFLRLVRAET